jgi:hypothetical protein
MTNWSLLTLIFNPKTGHTSVWSRPCNPHPLKLPGECKTSNSQLSTWILHPKIVHSEFDTKAFHPKTDCRWMSNSSNLIQNPKKWRKNYPNNSREYHICELYFNCWSRGFQETANAYHTIHNPTKTLNLEKTLTSFKTQNWTRFLFNKETCTAHKASANSYLQLRLHISINYTKNSYKP